MIGLNIIFLGYFFLFEIGILPEFEEERNQNSSTVLFDSSIYNSQDSLKVFFLSDTVHFILNNKDEVSISIPWNKKGNYPQTNLKGIFSSRGTTLVKSPAYKLDGIILFSIYDERNRGQLYGLDFKNLSFCKDRLFDRNYLISQMSLFLVMESENEISTVEKPYYNDSVGKVVTPISRFKIENGFFQFQKIKEYEGEPIYSDSDIINIMKDN